MPVPNASDPVVRAEPLPADVAAALLALKADVETVVDGAALPTEALRFSGRAATLAATLTRCDRPVQAADVRDAAAHLMAADDVWTRVMMGDEPPEQSDLDEFDRLVGDAHDRVCGALEAELAIHAPVASAEAA